MLEKHWDADRQRVKKSHSIAPALNHKLQQILIEAQSRALDADSAASVKASMAGNAGSMTAYFEAFIESLDRQGRYWDWRKYRVTLGKLQGEAAALSLSTSPNAEQSEPNRPRAKRQRCAERSPG